jgi:hypothetical protein
MGEDVPATAWKNSTFIHLGETGSEQNLPAFPEKSVGLQALRLVL